MAQGSRTQDTRGSRQNAVLIPPGTTAELVLPSGARMPLTSASVRVTEYTVGDNGPTAMPAVLPPTSGYTYAVELSVDEADAAGATKVQFGQPVYDYVENFLDFPIGGAVPAGA